MELMAGTEVTLLISRMNHFFKDENTKTFFEAELKVYPLILRVISGKRYFAFNAVVESNPKYNDFIDSNLTRLEIANLRCFHEDLTIRLQLKHSKYLVNFFHFDFFESIDTIQVWGTHFIECLALIQEYFLKSEFARVGAVVSTFIDELEGNVTLSTMPTGYYQKYIAVEKMKLQHQAELEDAVSTTKLHNIISVPNNDDAFEKFKNLVDTDIKEAVIGLYGEFSEFTQPIITQDMFRDLENAFRCLLPTQYHCICSMMGKGIQKDPLTTTTDQEILEHQWDRYAFFTFIQQCHLQNSHNFVWFSLINAASHFAGGQAHIPLHFGYSIAKNTMLRKLNKINTYNEIMMQSKRMLNRFKSFVVTIFDNS